MTLIPFGPSSGTGTATPAYQFTPEVFGAKGDTKAFRDGVMASTGSPVLTSATANFTSADVGKAIIVNVGAAGANQAPLITTILSWQSATQVTLNANPPATAAGNPFAYGTDDTAALRSAWAAAQAYSQSSPYGYGEMYLSKLYTMAGAPVLGSTSGPFYGNSLLPMTAPNIAGTDMARITGINCVPAGDSMNYFEQKSALVPGAGIFAMSAAPVPDGTWGIPSVIGGPTVSSGSGFTLTGGFANIGLHVNGNLKIVVPYNPGWIGIDSRYMPTVSGDRYGYQMFAVGVLGGGNGPTLGSVPGGSWNFNGAAIRFPVMNNNDKCDFGSITAEGVADAVWIADHVSIRRLTCINNANALVIDNTNGSGSGFIHGSWIGSASFEGQTNNLIVVAGSQASTFPLNIGLLDSENSGITDVNDAGVLTGTIYWYNINATTPIVSGTTRIKLINQRLGPGIWGGAPAVPATGVAVSAANLPWRDASVNIIASGATITAVTVGGTALTGITTGIVPVPDAAGTSIALSYTGGPPTWQWILD